MKLKHLLALCVMLETCLAGGVRSENGDWYTEGNYEPKKRVKVTLTNTLNIERKDCPVVIAREDLPIGNVPQRYITVVDPSQPSNPEPTQEMLRQNSGYLLRKETAGHYVEYQMDDLDKDGIWDELFFMVDIKPRETKTIYLYVEKAERGLYSHKTHAAIGYYGRHIVPFWESELMGWKLWFPTSVDLHGKRDPMMAAYFEYSMNLSGYYMPYEYGTDIMTVGSTLGSGGIGLIEYPAFPDSISRPPYDYRTGVEPAATTRYAFDVVVNGPLRSMIKVKTMNWDTGAGKYAFEQYYTAYAHKSYSTCRVKVTTFEPLNEGTLFCCGIREIMSEDTTVQNGGAVVSLGKNIEIRITDQDIGDDGLMVDFEGIALVVRDEYKPEYMNIAGHGGNHIFTIPDTSDRSFEYMILGGWSEGSVNTTAMEFTDYVTTEAMKYNRPLAGKVGTIEYK